MASLVRLGARVRLSDDQTPLGYSFYDFEDASGRRSVQAGAPATNLDLTPFVDLADGRRVELESSGLAVPITSLEALEEDVRETIFEADLREVQQFDEEVAEMPLELDEIAAALASRGFEVDDQALRALPFSIELDDSVRQRLGHRA